MATAVICEISAPSNSVLVTATMDVYAAKNLPFTAASFVLV